MKENGFYKSAVVLAMAGVLVLTGCFAKHTVAKLWTPEEANLPVEPTSGGASSPGPAVTETTNSALTPAPAIGSEKTAYQMIQPATAVDWARARILPDIHHLERDTTKAIAALQGQPVSPANVRMPRREFETLEQYNARVAALHNTTDRVYYINVKSDFLYNIDTQQFLVLPKVPSATPLVTTPATAPAPVEPRPAPVEPAPNPAAALEEYYAANEHFNAGEYLKATEAYVAFLRAHPGHPKTINVQFGLALCHFSLGQFDTAEPRLEQLDTHPDCPMPNFVKVLLAQCRAIRAVGKPVKSGMVFDLQLESKPSATPAPEECDPPAVPPPAAAPIIPVLPTTASSQKPELHGGLFRPRETPPAELTLDHQYRIHPAFFKTGVLHVVRAREDFEAEHKHPGRPGWILPGKYEPADARILKGGLQLVAGCRLARQPDPSVPGKYRDAFNLVSLHVLSVNDGGNLVSIHFAADLKTSVPNENEK